MQPNHVWYKYVTRQRNRLCICIMETETCENRNTKPRGGPPLGIIVSAAMILRKGNCDGGNWCSRRRRYWHQGGPSTLRPTRLHQRCKLTALVPSKDFAMKWSCYLSLRPPLCLHSHRKADTIANTIVHEMRRVVFIISPTIRVAVDACFN